MKIFNQQFTFDGVIDVLAPVQIPEIPLSAIVGICAALSLLAIYNYIHLNIVK